MRSPSWQHIKLGGICLDLEPPNVPADKWTFAANFHFKENAAERSGGYSFWYGEELPAALDPEVFAMNTPTPDANWWIFIDEPDAGAIATVYAWDGVSAAVQLDTGQFAKGAIWTGCILNGIPVLNSSIDGPWFWDHNPVNDLVELPGWDANNRCLCMRAFRYHLVALNLTENSIELPHKFIWSDGADPGTLPQTWTPAPDNEAGDGQLITTSGVILDGRKLRDQFVIYKSDSTYILDYVAGTFVFEQRPLFDHSGIHATDCVVEDSGFHYVLTDTDVIKHDGQSLESVATWLVKDTLLNNIESAAARYSMLVSRQGTDEIWICVPQNVTAGLDAAYVLNHITGEWGLRALPDPCYYVASGIIGPGTDDTWDTGPDVTWDTDARRWQQGQFSASVPDLIVGHTGGWWIVDGAPEGVSGAPVEAFIERTGLSLDLRQRALITAVYPEITGNTGEVLSIQVGGQDHFDNPVNWRPAVQYVLGSNDHIDCMVQERYVSIRFSSTGGSVWKLHGFKLETRAMGVY